MKYCFPFSFCLLLGRLMLAKQIVLLPFSYFLSITCLVSYLYFRLWLEPSFILLCPISLFLLSKEESGIGIKKR